MTDLSQKRATRIFVHLGANEYGNETMERIARETAARFADRINLVVSVCEHAGWFLEWFADGDKLVTVGTANDMARFAGRSAEIRAFLHQPGVEWEYIPGIRRD